MSSEDLTPEEIQALPVGASVYDKVDVEWVQTAPGRWWDKSYPDDTRVEIEGLLYYRYKPFSLQHTG